jgi:hypothetical protein
MGKGFPGREKSDNAHVGGRGKLVLLEVTAVLWSFGVYARDKLGRRKHGL